MSPSKNLQFREGKVTLTGDKIQCTKSQEGGTHGPCSGGPQHRDGLDILPKK